MSEAHARSWWADVEHLREAAERRSAERAKARIEGRDPVALTPLRPLHAVDGLAALDEALDDVQPVAPGEVPRNRRFARDGVTSAIADRRESTTPAAVGRRDGVTSAIADRRDGATTAHAEAEPPTTGMLTLVREEEPPAEADPAPPLRFQRRGHDGDTALRPRLRGSGRPPAAIPANPVDPSRRTVEIRGSVVPLPVALVPDQANDVGPARRRPPRRLGERFGASPDRVAAYAVLLGVVLIIVALLSAHGG